MTDQMLPGLQIRPGEISKRVITVGDPERAKKIAELLDDVQEVQRNREYWTYKGTYQGKELMVISHGVGASGAMLAFIGMMKGGAEAIIRVGTCGGLKQEVKAGSLIVATAAAREDGVTDMYVPRSYPAIADFGITSLLLAESRKSSAPVFDGVIVTHGAFYGGILPTNTVEQAESGAIGLEMELAALYVAASMFGKKAGSILSVDGSALAVLESAEDNDPDPQLLERTVDESIKIALDAIVQIEVE
ncbi:uridine phosphorylase [Enterococcus sp. PF1-24]|uniref:nucleoside phosphorylase n=1 Tax=unclassified Enterococcus TaxID=2608891 RepID=UPI00247422F8|nr:MULTISPECIES: nucleoside phosphorylase [unclassified Enterococcus]MDH6363954.1 uridine phosphorylase [Enterococcus sp. PFB1-1]MDH6401055.1 uridine phosphorylase [Enterococcus sp. PF1-24]